MADQDYQLPDLGPYQRDWTYRPDQEYQQISQNVGQHNDVPDWAAVEEQLRKAGGGLYDPSDLEGVKRNTSYAQGGKTLDQALQNQYQTYNQRAGSNGGGSQGGASKPGGSPSGYTPPPSMPSPFIMPNGQIPPGMPFSPNMQMQGMQDQLLQQILQNPVYGQTEINQLNEQQKELALQRGQAGQQALSQSAARRGTLTGGYQAGQQHRAADTLTQQLMQSNRDVNLGAAQTNRQGFLGALGASDSILGGREGRGLNAAQFAEMIRQYDSNLANNQSQFGANMDFNYNNLNAQLEQAFINSILNGGGA